MFCNVQLIQRRSFFYPLFREKLKDQTTFEYFCREFGPCLNAFPSQTGIHLANSIGKRWKFWDRIRNSWHPQLLFCLLKESFCHVFFWLLQFVSWFSLKENDFKNDRNLKYLRNYFNVGLDLSHPRILSNFGIWSKVSPSGRWSCFRLSSLVMGIISVSSTTPYFDSFSAIMSLISLLIEYFVLGTNFFNGCLRICRCFDLTCILLTCDDNAGNMAEWSKSVLESWVINRKLFILKDFLDFFNFFKYSPKIKKCVSVLLVNIK